ncbi:MAG TPA: FAD-binding oxidoreductase [Acidimicrobiales bacterium]|nr:FAD-binding oxidoreductase [Acidimicrobiales bacterium]
MGQRGPGVLTQRPVWDDEGWHALPSLDTETQADVSVVGLGGSGLAAVHEALDRGMSVVGIDAGTLAGGAAGRNGGFLLAGPADAYHVAVERLGQHRAAAIYRATLAEIDRMESATPESVSRRGSVRLSSSQEEDEDLHRQHRALVSDGFESELLRVGERVSLQFPRDASLQPLLRCRTLARTAMARGARLYEHSPALSISAGRVVTPAGSIATGAIVVAVDGGLDRVVPALAGRIRTARLQMLATEPTDEVDIRCPVYARWGFDYWQQLDSGAVVVGGLRDVHEADEWSHETTTTQAVQRGLDDLLRNVVGVERAAVTHRWAGSVGFTADHLPVFAEVDRRVVAIGGYSGTGNVIGALCGRAAVAYLADGSTEMADVLATRS